MTILDLKQRANNVKLTLDKMLCIDDIDEDCFYIEQTYMSVALELLDNTPNDATLKVIEIWITNNESWFIERELENATNQTR